MSEDHEEWRQSPHTKNLLKQIKEQRNAAHTSLMDACRNSSDPNVARWMGYYDSWNDSFLAIHRGETAANE